MSEYISKKCLTDSQAPQDAKIVALQNAVVGSAGGSLAGNYPNPSFSQAGVDSVLSGMALSTDATYGKSRSATSLETGAGVLNDGVHVSPADLLAAARTATTFAAAIAINPNKYGTFASVLAPTLAPTEANPQTILTNSNGEVFAYTGTKWLYIGGGVTGFQGVINNMQYPMQPILPNTVFNESPLLTITNPSSTRSMKVVFSNLTGICMYSQAAGNTEHDIYLKIVQQGVGDIAISYLGTTPPDYVYPAGQRVYLFGNYVIANNSVTISPGTSSQFKVACSTNNVGTTNVGVGQSYINASTLYKTEILG